MSPLTLINDKTVFNGDTAYITQLKRQKFERCCYFLQHVAIMSTWSKAI